MVSVETIVVPRSPLAIGVVIINYPQLLGSSSWIAQLIMAVQEIVFGLGRLAMAVH